MTLRRLSPTTAALAGLLLCPPAAAHGDHAEVTPPEVVSQSEPTWPEGSDRSQEVRVTLVLTVDAQGRVSDAQLATPPELPQHSEVEVSEFEAHAVEAAKRWRFKPALGPEGPLSAKIRAVIRFLPATEPSRAGPRKARTGAHGPAGHLPTDQTPAAAAPTSEGADQPTDQVYVRAATPPRTASAVERDRRVLSAAPHRTASDLLLTVPGTFVTQHSGEGKAHQIFFRGFDAVHGQDIEFWVGGAPVNEVSNVHGQGYADLHFVMPEVVTRVTALPGPYSPEQGDFAVAGSMDFELGYDEPGFTVSGSLGSYGARRAFLAYHPKDAPAETFGAFETYESDGFGVGRAAQRASAIAQIVHPLHDDIELRLLASTYAARFGSAGVLRLDDVESGRMDRFDSYDTAQGGRSGRTQVVADLRGALDDWHFHFSPYAISRSLELDHDFTGFLEDPVNGDSTQQLNDARTLGFRASLRRQIKLLNEHDSISVGIAGRDDSIEQSDRLLSQVTREVTASVIDSEVHAQSVSGFVDVSLRPLPRVVVRGGARWDALSFGITDHLRNDQTRSAQGTHFGKKGTLDVAVVPGLHALLSYGEGFRSPQARSLGAGERTPFTKVTSYEFGVRYGDAKRIRASFAAFHTDLSDDVVFLESVARNEPVPATQRNGAVIDFTAEPTPWFTSSLGATYTRATFTESGGDYAEGALVPFVPQMVVRDDLALKPTLGKLLGRSLVGTFGLGLTYLYRRPIPYGELGTNVFLMDARVAARLKEVELSLESFNLLDTDWNDGEFVYASNFNQGSAPSLLPVQHVSAGAPRTVMATLTLFI
ncbi:MAG: TonB-dependent receptor [Polyangiaceae bacterium]